MQTQSETTTPPVAEQRKPNEIHGEANQAQAEAPQGDTDTTTQQGEDQPSVREPNPEDQNLNSDALATAERPVNFEKPITPEQKIQILDRINNFLDKMSRVYNLRDQDKTYTTEDIQAIRSLFGSIFFEGKFTVEESHWLQADEQIAQELEKAQKAMVAAELKHNSDPVINSLQEQQDFEPSDARQAAADILEQAADVAAQTFNRKEKEAQEFINQVNTTVEKVSALNRSDQICSEQFLNEMRSMEQRFAQDESLRVLADGVPYQSLIGTLLIQLEVRAHTTQIQEERLQYLKEAEDIIKRHNLDDSSAAWKQAIKPERFRSGGGGSLLGDIGGGSLGALSMNGEPLELERMLASALGAKT